ncbi:MAG: hypothetical protein M3Q16_07410 [Pseudomonadota bacterium]|nr:hypothetical protein [Pseudomonadota bacterium]
MGALIFYIAIYFMGYYAAHLLNQMAGHGLIRNRRIAGLVLVVMVGMVHGYKIISTSPPHDHDDGAAATLGLYVVMPVAIIVIAVLFLMWQEGNDKDI